MPEPEQIQPVTAVSAEAFVQRVAAVAPVFTAAPSGEDYIRPREWQHLTLAGNEARLQAFTDGQALCAVTGYKLAVVDVDPRNGGDTCRVGQLLDGLGVQVFGEVETPGGGRHFYIPAHPDLPSSHDLLDYPGVDIQSHRANVFLPGTKRRKYDGRGYTVTFDNITALADGGDSGGAETFAAWVNTHRRDTTARTRAAAPPWDGTPPDRRQLAYLQSTLRSQQSQVAAARPGGRNKSLYTAALKLGNFVAGAGLAEPLVLATLIEAARTNGLLQEDGARAINATIQSGLETGRRSPRSVPPVGATLTPTVGEAAPAETQPGAQHIEGAEILDQLETFLGRFIAYPSQHTHIAHVLWVAHTHFMDHWESTPRIAFLSPEPGSGKSRCLEVTDPLVPRAVHAVNTTPAYLFRKVSDPGGAPTILYDEIDTVFGPKAKDNEEVRGMLNAGHRRGALAGRCVTRGAVIDTEELPAYCAVALAGLNDLPDTIMSRSIVIRMRRRTPAEKVEPWRPRINEPAAHALRELLRRWASRAEQFSWPEMPPGVEDRNADVWEALLAIADLAGGDWPDRARVAAVALVADPMGDAPSIGVQLLEDLHTVFQGHDKLSTDTILTELASMPESPWAEIRGQAITSRWLASHLKPYGVKPKTIRTVDGTLRGYDAADLADPWARYLVSMDGSL
jgi:Protein of unknown function (DUF3631)